MKLGLTYSEIDNLTVGEILDLKLADDNLKYAAYEQEKERKIIERFGRWAKTPDDFAILDTL